MKDDMCEEIAIKIKWDKDTYYDYDVDYNRKFKDTNLPLNGKYEDEEGNIRYFKNGKYHNENGPSFIDKHGNKEYCINDELHRIDGPAAIYCDVSYEWFINGYPIYNEIMDNWLIENDIPLDWNMWSNEDKMLFALHWSDYNG